MRFKTLIIEDEEPARIRLEKLLSQYSENIELVGSAVNGREGLEKINSCNPDLIFLDIQMPGMTGFEMLSKLDEVPLIIFCTAYDDYALQAFETNSIDYLLKPVKIDRLEQTIAKLKKIRPGLSSPDIMRFLKSFEQNKTKKELTSLTVKTGKKILFLKLKEIAYFKAKDKYVNVCMKNGKEHLSEESLHHLNAQLPHNFKQIHRSLILNTDFIKEVHSYFNSRFAFILGDKDASKLISGRSFQKSIKEWINL
ncbi:response regulator [Salegentibacter sp. BLCTC]|uniref:LytR/AlgR family response regulator transcription factor n=1 Tax=Salegentibacter sp. BLCTC TaxID=2697368 RepID=UPI00187BB8E3|nr:LytTR family DNA-binding domain-containing protein [Salegentibacter sp. BLCTC]MBE7639553.1 response regulator [Salegentibacter sp. BLCTC]